MSITSINFILFIIVLFLTYFLILPRYQWIVLLLGSVYFYWLSSKEASIYIGVTIITVYLCGLWLERLNTKQDAEIHENPGIKKAIKKKYKSKKKKGLAITVVFNLGLLLLAKYYNFIGENIEIVSQALGGNFLFTAKQLVVPLGISFYTFQAVGYLFDLYREKTMAEKNFLRFVLTVSFFPQIVQGPFNRYKDLRESLFQIHFFSFDRFISGAQRALWGIIKKIVIADRLGLFVSPVFSTYSSCSGTQIFLGSVAYTIQIYADFSGYMDIMCGICEIFGITMSENFRRPYFSKSVAEFWRRWHITLGAWFREYMFYPISMSKSANKLGKYFRKIFGAKFGKLLPSYIALVAVWFCTGLWHGANWTYVVWALINVFFILTSMQFEDFYALCREKAKINENSTLWKMFQITRTFLLVCFMRIFSRANNIQDSIGMYKKIFSNFSLKELFSLNTYKIGIEAYDMLIILIFVFIMLLASILQRKGEVRKILSTTPIYIRWMVYICGMFSAILFATTSGGGFLYAVF